jgi:DNA-binding transcriptional ArsR family regulator
VTQDNGQISGPAWDGPRTPGDIGLSDLLHELDRDQCWDVIAQLATRPRCVSELAERLGERPCTASKELKLLRRLGLVKFVRDGTRHVYQLNTAMFKVEGSDIELTVDASDGAQLRLRCPLGVEEPVPCPQ